MTSSRDLTKSELGGLQRGFGVPCTNLGRRVLVVDDDEDSAELLGAAVGALGHTVRVAHDAPAALEIAATFQPQVALIDIGLPAMDGYELGHRLRQLSQAKVQLRLVAITGYGRAQDLRRSREEGFDQHVIKPVDPAALRDLVAGKS